MRLRTAMDGGTRPDAHVPWIAKAIAMAVTCMLLLFCKELDMRKHLTALGFVGTLLAAFLFMAPGPQEASCNPFRLLTAANTNPTLVATGHRNLTAWAVTSNNTALFFHVYDKATAPTVGTDTPVQSYGIPASVSGTTSYTPVFPLNLLSGLGIGTSANVDGTGNVAANAIVNLCWQ